MDSDRELLEMAAKAAGITLIDRAMGANGYVIDGAKYWNPLTDDGDALRLAVKLGICIEFGYCEDDAPVVYAGLAHERRDWPRWPNFPDSRAATRRAIVRAAAELGRRG